MPRKKPAPLPKNAPPPGIIDGAAFEHYALYLALGIEERVAVFQVAKGTEEDFAKKFNVDRKTLWNWKREPKLWAARDKHLVGLKQYTGPILRALARNAMQRGAAYEVETWMRLVEGYVPKAKNDHHVEGLADLIAADMGGDETAKDEHAEHPRKDS